MRETTLGARLQSLFRSTPLVDPENYAQQIFMSSDIKQIEAFVKRYNDRETILGKSLLRITYITNQLTALEEKLSADVFKAKILRDLLHIINALTQGCPGNILLNLIKTAISSYPTTVTPITLDLLTLDPIVITQFDIVTAVLRLTLTDIADLIPTTQVTNGYSEAVSTSHEDTLFYKRIQYVIEKIASQFCHIIANNNIAAILEMPHDSYVFPEDEFYAAKLQGKFFISALEAIPANSVNYDRFLQLQESLIRIPQLTNATKLDTFSTPRREFLKHCSTFLTKYITNKITLATTVRLLDPILINAEYSSISIARYCKIFSCITNQDLKAIISEMTEQEFKQIFTDFDQPLAETSRTLTKNHVLARLLTLEDISFPHVPLECVAQLLRSTPYMNHHNLKLAIQHSLPTTQQEIATLLNYFYLREDYVVTFEPHPLVKTYVSICSPYRVLIPTIRHWITPLSDAQFSELWAALSDTARYTLKQIREVTTARTQFFQSQEQGNYSSTIHISDIAGMIKIFTDHCRNSAGFFKRPTCWKITALRHATQNMSVQELQDNPNHVEAMIKLIFIELDRWCPTDSSIRGNSGSMHIFSTRSGDVCDRLSFLARMINRDLSDIYESIPHQQKIFTVPITEEQAKKFDAYEKRFFSTPGVTYSNQERAVRLLRDYIEPSIFKDRTLWKLTAVRRAIHTETFFRTLSPQEMIQEIFAECRRHRHEAQLTALINTQKNKEFYDVLTYLSVLAGKPLTEILDDALSPPDTSSADLSA